MTAETARTQVTPETTQVAHSSELQTNPRTYSIRTSDIYARSSACLVFLWYLKFLTELFNPFRTAVPFWGQITYDLTGPQNGTAILKGPARLLRGTKVNRTKCC